MGGNSNSLVDLSIIIPIYNVDPYLHECLTSVYAIGGITTQIILINDGSTDNSDKIIHFFVDKFKTKTIYIKQKNTGLSGARNRGLLEATGDYLLFVDSDDFINYDHVSFIVHYAKRYQLDLLQARSETFGDTKTRVLPVPSTMLSLPVVNGSCYLKAYCDSATIKNKDFRPEVWSLLVKSRVFFENKLQFKENMYFEDELILPEIILNSQRVKMLDVVFYHYRIRPNSIMTSCSDYHQHSKAMLVVAYYQMMRKYDFYHPFLSCRLIGWCNEALKYLSVKQLSQIFKIKKVRMKDKVLLIFLIFKRCLAKVW